LASLFDLAPTDEGALQAHLDLARTLPSLLAEAGLDSVLVERLKGLGYL
jgi:hypothetical protein